MAKEGAAADTFLWKSWPGKFRRCLANDVEWVARIPSLRST